MKLSISSPLFALVLVLPTAAPLLAGEVPPAALGARASTGIIPAAFGDGPSTGAHHGKRNHSSATSNSVAPSHADLHGATRESADKAYRKQYGF